MADFALLPPEVNSGCMYAGPGAGPMLSAAAGWQALAAELDSTAVGYSSVIAELAGQVWSGPTSMAMAAAATPYVQWLSATGVATAQTAVQAYAAAAAYEAAFAMTVPPTVVAANRAQLMMLIATNFLGQNTPAIAATEAQYMEMWVQDATAMYGYAADSQSATMLTSFSEPPPTANATGQDAQARAVAQATSSQPTRALSQSLEQAAAAPKPNPTTTIGPGVVENAGTDGATVVVNQGSVTVGVGSAINVTETGTFTAGTSGATLHGVLDLPSYTLGPGVSMSIPSGWSGTVTTGSVNVPVGSIVTVGPSGSVTGGAQSGATVTVTSGSLSPAMVTPVPATTPAVAPAPAATSTTSTTSSASSASTTSTTSTSGTTSAGTATPAGQPSAPAAQPQAAPGVPQAAPGIGPPPLAAPGGAPAAVAGGPAASGGPMPLGDPLQLASGAPQPAPATPDLALGAQPSSQPSILLPINKVAAVTSGTTLLAAGGSSVTTFFSTKDFFSRGETVETKMQNEALIRDVSLRFVKSLDTVQGQTSSSSMLELSARLDQLMSSNQAVRNLFDQVQAGATVATADQALELLSGAAGPTPPTLEQIAAVTFRAAPGEGPEMVELNSIMAEMKFIMPSDVLLKAQYAAIATLFAAHISEADTPTSNWNQASSAAVTDFVEAVRSDFGLDPIAVT